MTTAASEGYVIKVEGDLTITDNSPNKTGTITGSKNTGNGGGVCVEGANAKFTMNGGTISGNTATGEDGGGGVYVINGTFTMKGGKIIRNNTNSYGNGGGVYMNGGTFNMQGGTIGGAGADKNEAPSGGGVYVGNGCKFTMSGNSTISGNKSAGTGGGVFLEYGTFTMEGGTITGNTTTDGIGGGVCMGGTDTYFTMKDGTISDNTSTGYGGDGVYVNGGTFTMEKGMISGNKATGNNNNGGGVSNSGSGTFEMNGGKIQGNEAAYYAGVRVDGGSFTMKAGEISGNKANQSIGGVYVYSATFTMSGGKIVDNTASVSIGGVRVLSSTFNLSGEVDISGNKAGNADKNVVLSDGQIITIQGELKNANPIGVSFSSALTGDTVFTSDYGSKMSNADPAKYFKSEQDGYGVFWNDGKTEAMFGESVTITFDANGGTGTMEPWTAPKGKKRGVPAPECEFTRRGHTFYAWLFNYLGTDTIIEPGGDQFFSEGGVFQALWNQNEVEVSNPEDQAFIGDSPELHAITGGYDAKYCNAKSVKLNKSAVTLKVGKTTTVKATVKGVKSGKKLLQHVCKVRWYSSNINVATVSKSGKIKATGKCTIWAIANNGVRTSVKVTVK